MTTLKVGNKRCQCPTCEEYFNSVVAFDRHRVFDDPKKPDWTTRHCDTSKLVKNAAGYWCIELMPENIKELSSTQ